MFSFGLVVSCSVYALALSLASGSLKVVAIKQITEDARMRSEQQLAFVREMSVLTQVPCSNLPYETSY